MEAKVAERQCREYNRIMDIVKNDKKWKDGISHEEWDKLSEYKKHLWLLDSDVNYERAWNNAIKKQNENN